MNALKNFQVSSLRQARVFAFATEVEPPPVEDDPIVPFRVFRLQEPEAPINNATSRGLRRDPTAGAGGLQVAEFTTVRVQDQNQT
jgi:hypothetical protein